MDLIQLMESNYIFSWFQTEISDDDDDYDYDDSFILQDNQKDKSERKIWKKQSERKNLKEKIWKKNTERIILNFLYRKKNLKEILKENLKEKTERKNNTQQMIDNFIEFGLDPTYGEQSYIFLISDRNFRWWLWLL